MNNEHEESLDGLLAQAVQQVLDTPQAHERPADLDAMILQELSRLQEPTDTVRRPVSDPDSRPSFRKRLVGFARPAAVAVIVLVALGIWMTMPGNRSVLAEVIRRMEQARSVRCVLESKTPNDEWVKTWEVEFERKRGFRELHYDNNVIVQTEIDDGRNHWIHRQGSGVATRGAAIDFTMQLQRLLSPIAGDQKFQPEPGHDQPIQGVACRCFIAVWETTPPQWNQRVSLWIDEEGRARRMLMEGRPNESDPWMTYQQAHVEYDLDMDAVDFSPHFPDNTRIVDLAETFDGVCSLDTAIHREVTLGYELAVHDLKRISPLQYYMLLSFRPTKETLRRLKLGPGETPGDLRPGMRSEMKHFPPGTMETETAFELASARADGVLVKAFFCNVSESEESIPTHARPGFTIFANAQLWKHVPGISQISIDVPLPEDETPLRDVIRSVYDMIAMLETIPLELVQLNDERDERGFVDRRRIGGGMTLETHRKQHPRPSEISFEKFLEHIEQAPWAKQSKTREALRDERRQIEQEWGSQDPWKFLQELDAPEAHRPMFWHARLADLIKTPNPTVQIAAIEHAQKSGSLELAYFSVLPTFETSTDSHVRAAAERVLAHYRRSIEPTKPAPSEPALQIPIEQIEKSMKRLDHSETVAEAIHDLRRLTGLDFGDGSTVVSRQNWTTWWSHERDSINNAANGSREFVVYGRITDPAGTPLPAIPIRVEVSTRLFASIDNTSARTESDNNGLYVLRFGFFKTEPPAMPIVNVVIRSTKFATLPAWVGGNHVLSRFQLDADPHANIRTEGIIFSGRPVEMNVVQTKPDNSQ